MERKSSKEKKRGTRARKEGKDKGEKHAYTNPGARRV